MGGARRSPRARNGRLGIERSVSSLTGKPLAIPLPRDIERRHRWRTARRRWRGRVCDESVSVLGSGCADQSDHGRGAGVSRTVARVDEPQHVVVLDNGQMYRVSPPGRPRHDRHDLRRSGALRATALGVVRAVGRPSIARGFGESGAADHRQPRVPGEPRVHRTEAAQPEGRAPPGDDGARVRARDAETYRPFHSGSRSGPAHSVPTRSRYCLRIRAVAPQIVVSW